MHRHKRKLYIWGCLINVIALWAILAFQYRYDRQQADKTVQTHVSNLAKAFQENTLRTVQYIDGFLLDLRRVYPEMSREAFDQHILSYGQHHQQDLIIQVSVLDENGILAYNNKSMPASPMDLSDREHFKIHRVSSDDRLFISKPVLGRVSNKWSIQFTRKMLKKDGSFAGVIVLSVAPEYFTAFYSTIDLGKKGVITLLGKDGVIRARSGASEGTSTHGIGVAAKSNSPLIDPSKPSAGIYHAPSIVDGVNRIVAYQRLTKYPLVVRVALAEEEAYSTLARHRNSAIGIGVLCTFGLFFGLFLALKFNRMQESTFEQLAENEKRYRESQQQLSDIINFLPDATLAIDNDGRIIIWNKAMEEMTGVRASDMMGKGEHACTVPFYGERRRHLLDLLDSTDAELEAKYQHVRRSGDRLYAEAFAPALYGGKGSYIWVTGAPLYSTSGERIGAIESMRDISTQKQAEQSLRESGENLKSLLESIPVGIVWSNGAGTIEYLNSSFVQHYGYTSEDIPTFQEWFHRAYPDPAYRDELRKTWAAERAHASASDATSMVVTMSANITCKDGTVRNVIITTLLSPDRALAIFTDITEREMYQQELLKAQKLESLGVLAGGIAHDFNNILTGILGNISFARMFLDTSHRAAAILQQAENAAQRASELAYQLLTFAKGGQPVKRAVSARRLIDESVSLVLRGSNVKGVLEISDDLQAIMADPGQMTQAFNNIIINAVHAMAEGGTLTIRAENMVLAEKNSLSLPAGEYVHIAFSDQGCGISSEHHKRIFDPYFTTKPKGSGLGLASVHSIVTRHGGAISMHSEIGRGTTFEVVIPSAGIIPVVQGNPNHVLDLPQKSDAAILVMDDEELIRNLVSDMLGVLGYRVRTCANGEETISVYRSGLETGTPFSAVIMDITVPGGMGGKDAAQHILQIDPGARLIVSSGYSDNPIMANFREFGFCAAVIKPYRAAEIAHTLSTILQSDQSL